jgi:hypothetical protein
MKLLCWDGGERSVLSHQKVMTEFLNKKIELVPMAAHNVITQWV